MDQTPLEKSLSGLSELTLMRPLDTVLTNIAGFAAEAIPGAGGAGLALIRTDRPDTVVASKDFVRYVDNAQYELDEGPCLDACAVHHTQTSGSLGTDRRWPRFGPEAERLGVQSALSLPLLLSDRVVGSLNVYARARDAFTEEAIRIGERFSIPAAVSVASAYLLVEHQARVEALTSGLTEQAAIHQAIGIVMSRTELNAVDSLATLRTLAAEQGTTLPDIGHRLSENPHLSIAIRDAGTP